MATQQSPSTPKKAPRITKKQQLADSALQPPSAQNYRCQECQRFKDNRCYTPFQAPAGSSSPRVLVVGASPDVTDDDCGKAFTGPAERLFIGEVLKKLGFTKDEVAFTNAVRCYSPDKPGAKHVKLCGAFVHQDIAALKPEFVVALGGEAASAVLRQTGAEVKANIGHVVDVDGTHVLVSYSPRAVLAKKDVGFLHFIYKQIKNYIDGVQPKEFPEMKVLL
jgi:uracil-DNA glycosylase family 4